MQFPEIRPCHKNPLEVDMYSCAAIDHKMILTVQVRGSFKKYVEFGVLSRRHITLRFGTHIWTTNSVDLRYKVFNLTF